MISTSELSKRRTLRQQLKRKRLAIDPAARINAANCIAVQLLEYLNTLESGYVAGYWAVAGELPLHAVQIGLSKKHIWCLPVVQSDKTLKFLPWQAGDRLQQNSYGIPEPLGENASQLQANDLVAVLVPLVGFDRLGFRLGMGGGYYDRSFAFRREKLTSPKLIGIAYSNQEIENTDMLSEWDIPMDIIVTEKELINCRPAVVDH